VQSVLARERTFFVSGNRYKKRRALGVACTKEDFFVGLCRELACVRSLGPKLPNDRALVSVLFVVGYTPTACICRFFLLVFMMVAL